MIERLTLVRHGETVHNVAGIAQGWNDSALSDAGERQVAALAGRLKNERVDAIFSSPLQRALTTAHAIAEAAGLGVQTIDDLREMSYGVWEGRSFLEVRNEYDTVYHRWIEDPDCPCPEGESHSDVRGRMTRALETIRGSASHPVVVTHGTAIRIAATALLDAPVTIARHLAIDNAAISIFVRRGDRLVLKLWNDTTHCRE